jgi:two-component system OmpR family sensor kinase
VARENGRAVIQVGDSGPGLTEDELARVFERFYRADSSRARASGGVGLGLSIVAAVARAHGGRVDVRSEPELGATFRVELPVA